LLTAPPKEPTKDIAPNPKDIAKTLPPVSPQSLIDFQRGLIFGKLEETTNFKFKYQAWGLYPLKERQDLETLAQIVLVKQAREVWDLRHTTNVLQPEQSKEVQKAAMEITQGLVGIYKGRPKK
jgi:hypothetical protein